MQRIQDLNTVESTSNPQDDRKGSILVIVIALLGMLLLLGIAFYSFAAQEHVSAGYFAETYKERLPGLSAETLFDYGLEQLIVGPSSTQKQSALYGRYYSLIGNMLGSNGNTLSGGFFDPVPYNGSGVNLALNATNGPIVDLDYNGTDDGLSGAADPLKINLSAAANLSGAANATETDPYASGRPQPDVGYTYPDINNLFLAHISEPTDDINGKRVIIPSFFRPQILRDGSGAISATWYQDSGLEGKLLRPHPDHLIAGSTTRRFITTSTPETNVLGNAVNPFPFAVDSKTNPNSTLGELGVWTTAATDDDYDFDADNDNDGTNEGIWIDLGFPAQTLIDGRRYVPMFSFTVQDADGLINLNTAGNFNELLDPSNDYNDASSAAMQTVPISTSNLGVSRAEVNPLWALTKSPGSLTAGEQDEFKYFANLTGSMSRTAIANMEFIHIKNGQKRDDGAGGDEYNVGAWGELATLQAGGISSPGTASSDDDFDGSTGLTGSDPLFQISSGISFPTSTFLNSGTPLDLRGFGSFVGTLLPDGVTSSSNGLVAQLISGSAGDPNRWVRFNSYMSGSYWGSATTLGGALAINSLAQATQLQDEADETIVEPLLSDVGGSIQTTIENDSIYGPEEMLGLHLTNTEYTSVAGTSRLKKLVPINFSDEAIRKQFTTVSNDRAEFTWLPSVKRPWEFNADVDSDGSGLIGFEFPPASLGAAASNPLEPIRTALRNLLRVERESNEPSGHVQFPLQLNGVLTGYNATTGRPIYRSLTPHPETGLGNSPITTPGGGIVEPPVISNANDQEFWARRDRQLLARDIYVLLYLLGGGDDTVNYATDSNGANALYSVQQLREMAQFAVNYVDSMDRDNVITRFEYDKDLSNGWNLDDNAYADEGGDRAEVFGVEAQELTISEWLGVRIPQAGGMNPDHPVTRQNDTLTPAVGDYWCYIELKSVSPHDVSLANWGWRIRKIGVGEERRLTLKGETSVSDTIPAGGQYVIGSTTLLETDSSSKYHASDLRIDYDRNGSFNRVFPSNIETSEASIPIDTMLNPTPASNLDLVYNYDSSSGSPTDKFILTDSADTHMGVGEFLKPAAIPSTERVLLILERRLNQDRIPPVDPAVDDPDNPWVCVDRMVIEAGKAVQDLALDMANNANDTEDAMRGISTPPGKIRTIVSRERKQPLEGILPGTEGDCTAGAAGTASALDFVSSSTLAVPGGTKNSISPNNFSYWQPHFDRELSSSYDLLSIPLYGPPSAASLPSGSFDSDGVPVTTGNPSPAALLRGMTTELLVPSLDNAKSGFTHATLVSDPTPTNFHGVQLVSSKKFLRPDYDDTASPSVIFNNRWYRLLDLVNVGTQTNRLVQWTSDGVQGAQWSDIDFPARLPGAINLNTIRHRGVLAGLIDDPNFHLNSGYASIAAMLSDPNESRNWWAETIGSRDLVDPVTSLILPGLPGSRPYRSGGFLDRVIETDANGNTTVDPGEDTNGNGTFETDTPGVALQQTMLRDLALDGTAIRRNLFEARINGGATEVDYHARHRLLRKIANNTTNRSNVFIVWMTVGFFEAVDDSASGSVRIGAQLAGLPEHRGFFIVDRTLLEKAEVEASTNGRRFDYKKFITYRKTLK